MAPFLVLQSSLYCMTYMKEHMSPTVFYTYWTPYWEIKACLFIVNACYLAYLFLRYFAALWRVKRAMLFIEDPVTREKI